MKILAFMAILFTLGLGSLGASGPVKDDQGRIVPLWEVEEPFQICVENGRVYIVDDKALLVFEYTTGRLLTKIGQPGQGPGEFTMMPLSLNICGDRLVIRDMRRVLFFSPEGEFISQMREPEAMLLPLLPIGKSYVGFALRRLIDGSFTAVGCIYDSQVNLVKKFYDELPVLPPVPPRRTGPGERRRNVLTVREYADYVISGNRIFVADSRKGLSISVFDERGEFLYEINHETPRIRIPRNFKDQTGKEYDEVTASFFPAFVSFKIDGERIYVITPEMRDGLYKVVVMDLRGRILNTAFRFPLRPNFSVPHTFTRVYDIEDDRFVWYEYNEAKVTYEMHVR